MKAILGGDAREIRHTHTEGEDLPETLAFEARLVCLFFADPHRLLAATGRERWKIARALAASFPEVLYSLSR